MLQLELLQEIQWICEQSLEWGIEVPIKGPPHPKFTASLFGQALGASDGVHTIGEAGIA
jgi:hypothetical protein